MKHNVSVAVSKSKGKSVILVDMKAAAVLDYIVPESKIPAIIEAVQRRINAN